MSNYTSRREALAELTRLVRADERAKHGERIAAAIEQSLNLDDCGNDPLCEACALVRLFATIARTTKADQ